MPPKVKFQKEEIVRAGFDLVGERGAAALTAREVASALGVSTRPIFTYFKTMDELRSEVNNSAKDLYVEYITRGLAGNIPFLNLWRQYLHFAKEEPHLYRLLFLTGDGGAAKALKLSQDLARESIMKTYSMDGETADSFFRDIWLVAFSFATLIVTGGIPFSEEKMLAIGAEVSLAVCKAYKEIPGLPSGEIDRDAIFRERVRKKDDMEDE